MNRSPSLKKKSATPEVNSPALTAPVETFSGLTSNDRAAREEILHRAYSIWESEGCPENRQLAHWLMAEAAVLGQASCRNS
jgi:hypothetical protein